MLAAIRLRGHIYRNRPQEDTLSMLGLKKVHTVVVLPESQVIKGMLKNAEDFIAWGELSKELEQQFAGAKRRHMKPPKKGYKSLKKHFPKGDLGYRGQAINDLIKRMM
jgi:large subunit ribosomal protein L30